MGSLISDSAFATNVKNEVGDDYGKMGFYDCTTIIGIFSFVRLRQII